MSGSRRIRTDLALETTERFAEENAEIRGVEVHEEYDEEKDVRTTVVKIVTENGAKSMGRPQGTYITIESEELLHDDDDNENLLLCICEELERMVKGLREKRVLIAGLGNRHVTSDSLGPRMVEEIFVTRHYENEFGRDFMKKHQYGNVSAIAPGVMGQTGMEAGEVLKGVVEKTHPELVIVVDALAARSLSRVCTTVQLTDTGISPGSGIGNVRRALSKETLGVPVVAVGIPTVVDARTIISDHLEQVLTKQGYLEWEREQFIREVLQEETKNLFVTPKNVDESVRILAKGLAKVMNYCLQKKSEEYFEENTDTL